MEEESADAVRYIRESSRSQIKLYRRNQRDEVSDKRRLLPNTLSSNPEEVAKIANKLKTKASITVEELRNLKNALFECDKNTDIVLNTHGALRGLVRELSGHDPEKQYEAAGCCCNMALSDVRACLTVAKAAGPYLVTGLDSLNSEFQATCACALGNVCADRRACGVLQAQGAVAMLCKAAGAVLYALERVARQAEGTLSTDHLRAMVAALHAPYPAAPAAAPAAPAAPAARARLLATLSCHPGFPLLDEVNEAFLCNLLEALAASTPAADGEFVYLVRTAANLCFEPRVCDTVTRYLVEKDLGATFKSVLSANDSRASESVMWLLGNLLNFSSDTAYKGDLFNVVCS